MEPGPLPPHERSWRHPSELGPTRVDVDDPSRRSYTSFVALAGGTMAVLAVATMVVAMTPRTGDGPVALSSTTTPVSTRDVAPPASTDTEPSNVETVRFRPTTALLTSFAAFPHAVTSGPQLDLDGTDVALESPSDDDIVFLRTEAVTYRLQWDEVRQLTVPDGSVVFDADGDLVARVSGGNLLSLVDD